MHLVTSVMANRNTILTSIHYQFTILRLVTRCGNGSAMVVLKGYPYMLAPDYNKNVLIGMAIMAKLMDKIMGIEVVTTRHHVAALSFLIFLFAIIIAWLF